MMILIKKVGFTYLSSLSAETVNHSKTYFGSKFETLNQILNAVINTDMDEENSKEYILDKLAGNELYVALLTEDGEREVLKGDKNIHPLDMERFEEIMQIGEDKVILTVNDSNDRIIEMVKFCDFNIGDKKYCAMLCGFSPETMNTVLNLFYSEEMVYSL